MSKYNTYLEVLKATLAKYEFAKKTCNVEGMGVYTHVNGLGCAIGCHFPPEVAATFQEIAQREGQYVIGQLKYRSPIVAEHMAYTFGPDISDAQLSELQCAHDNTRNVSEFVSKLERLIRMEEENNE